MLTTHKIIGRERVWTVLEREARTAWWHWQAAALAFLALLVQEVSAMSVLGRVLGACLYLVVVDRRRNLC
jgi:hypothetical protein